MDRLEKKCLIASAGTHAFLLLLVVTGSAFFVGKPKPAVQLPAIRVIPGRLVDAAVAGGGGNPKIAPSEDRIKGDTLEAQPKPAEPIPQPKPQPQPEKKKPETAKKADKVKPEPVPVVKKKDAELAAKDDILKRLKPAVRSPEDRAKQRKEAEARQAAAEARAAEARDTALRSSLVKAFGKAERGLQAGFKDGTKVEVNGPGGEAYASYAAWVKEVYDDAWMVPNELTDEDSITTVTVTIARSGHVIAAEIHTKSGNSSMDKSVRRTLDKVKFIRPFPEGATDQERTFTIDFNLKAKKRIG